MTQSVTLSQKAYIDAVTSHFHLENAKPAHTPMETGIKLPQVTRVEGNEWPFPYREMIGALMYAVTATRPDIAFATLTLAQYMQNPTWIHWEAAKRVVQYLKMTHDLELTYGPSNARTIGYMDANHASQTH